MQKINNIVYEENIYSNINIIVYNYDFSESNISFIIKNSNHKEQIDISSNSFLLLDFTTNCKISNSIFGPNGAGIFIDGIDIIYTENNKIITFKQYGLSMINIETEKENSIKFKYIGTKIF